MPHRDDGQKFETKERTPPLKTLTLIVAVTFAVLLSAASANAQLGCNAASWNPESYCFYGAKDKIIEKFGKIEMKLPDRRVFLQVTQGESGAFIKLYEREKNGTFTVTEWTAKHTSQLLSEIDKQIIANKGVNCVGEQVKGVLGKELKAGKVSKDVPAPESPKAAFEHSVNEAKGEFIKSVVILLC